jgi:predicted dehydrogenase
MKLAMEHPDQFRIVAAADPVTVRAEQVRDFAPEEERAGIRLFANADELLSQPKMADVAIIGTQDDYHFEPAKRALELGYDLLLEKPIAKTLREALELRNLAEKLGRRVAICHVLRYTPFYCKIKELLMAGTIGEVVSLDQVEAIGNVHFSHSYVRGNWHNEAESTPMLLAKS